MNWKSLGWLFVITIELLTGPLSTRGDSAVCRFDGRVKRFVKRRLKAERSILSWVICRVGKR